MSNLTIMILFFKNLLAKIGYYTRRIQARPGQAKSGLDCVVLCCVMMRRLVEHKVVWRQQIKLIRGGAKAKYSSNLL